MQIQISEQPPGRLAEIAAGVATVLDDVRASVEDWPLMRERCREVIAEPATQPPVLPDAKITEGLAFLRTLDDDHFTYIGYRQFAFQGCGGGTRVWKGKRREVRLTIRCSRI